MLLQPLSSHSNEATAKVQQEDKNCVLFLKQSACNYRMKNDKRWQRMAVCRVPTYLRAISILSRSLLLPYPPFLLPPPPPDGQMHLCMKLVCTKRNIDYVQLSYVWLAATYLGLGRV